MSSVHPTQSLRRVATYIPLDVPSSPAERIAISPAVLAIFLPTTTPCKFAGRHRAPSNHRRCSARHTIAPSIAVASASKPEGCGIGRTSTEFVSHGCPYTARRPAYTGRWGRQLLCFGTLGRQGRKRRHGCQASGTGRVHYCTVVLLLSIMRTFFNSQIRNIST